MSHACRRSLTMFSLFPALLACLRRDAARRFLCACGATFLFLSGPGGARAERLTIYTAVGATTAQAPLMGAIQHGWGKNDALEIRYWKDLDDLRGVILAGKGDIWVGHLEGFAQATRQGALVTLIALTAWEDKFRFLTLDPTADSPAAMASHANMAAEELALTPKGSAVAALLEAARPKGGPAFRVADFPPQQLIQELAQGKIRYVAAPEPLATALTARFPSLRDVGGLSALHKPVNDQGLGIPIAGVAVRSSLLAEHPEKIHALVAAMVQWAQTHKNDPGGVAGVLPAETLTMLGKDTIIASLQHDPIAVVDAKASRQLIEEALQVLDGRAEAAERAPAALHP